MLTKSQAAFIAALRSGKYEQHHGDALRDGNAFSVLGVACDASNLGEWNDNVYSCSLADYHDKGLPLKVTFGLMSRTIWGNYDQNENLWILNRTMNFLELADFIENNWYKMFHKKKSDYKKLMNHPWKHGTIH
jgi:hypothetical protein